MSCHVTLTYFYFDLYHLSFFQGRVYRTGVLGMVDRGERRFLYWAIDDKMI